MNQPESIPQSIMPLLSAYLRRRQARSSPAAFAQLASRGSWILAPHLALLSAKLVGVARGHIKRLIVMMPPRSGKSWLISRYFPAWFIGSNPDKRIILASYEADFAGRWGAQARDLLQEHGGSFFGVQVNPDSSSSARWDIANHAGGMNSVGVGGAITGKGCHVFLIDDPLKNSEEAHSPTFREKQWDWFRSVAYTRLEPGAAIILTMARWHEDDLVGRLLVEAEQGGERWDVLRLPAIAEDEYDPLGRELGQPLWPERYDAEALDSIRRTVGGRVWSALYQQRPAPAEGNIIQKRWLKYWTRATSLPMFEEMIQSWDLAFKGEDRSDYVVGQVWGLVGADRYLIDQVRGHLDFPQTVAAIRKLSERWPQSDRKLVEDAANGAALVATLHHEISGLIPVKPQGNKEARVHAITAMLESGNVYIPSPSEVGWVDEFIDECIGFPSAKHDDQVDAMSQALNYRGGFVQSEPIDGALAEVLLYG
ncbi:MAG: phage terminase large subunit [Acidobacteriota bacterium]